MCDASPIAAAQWRLQIWQTSAVSVVVLTVSLRSFLLQCRDAGLLKLTPAMPVYVLLKLDRKYLAVRRTPGHLVKPVWWIRSFWYSLLNQNELQLERSSLLCLEHLLDCVQSECRSWSSSSLIFDFEFSRRNLKMPLVLYWWCGRSCGKHPVARLHRRGRKVQELGTIVYRKWIIESIDVNHANCHTVVKEPDYIYKFLWANCCKLLKLQ